MAKYRQVQVAFWQDNFVLDLTPEEKYFYLYLMTNPKATQIGIYELPLKVIEMETGYNRETVEKLIARFEDYGKIVYSQDTKEIMITNWIKHNWNSSQKVISRVDTELRGVKDKSFIQKYLIQVLEVEENQEKIQYLYGMDTVSIDYGYKDKEKEKNKDKEKDKDNENDNESDQEKERVGVVFDKYVELGFGTINAFKAEQITEWLKIFEPDVVIKSLEVASNNNKATMNYVNGILNNWKQRDLTTLEKVEAEEKRKQVEQLKPSYQQRRREQPGEVAPSWLKDEDKPKPDKPSGPVKTAAEDPEIQKMIADFRKG